MDHRIADVPQSHDLCRAAADSTIELAVALSLLPLAPEIREALDELEQSGLRLLIAARREELKLAPEGRAGQ